ncbi:RNA-directed DNA polymerase, eukaryota [Tanacetum coccineum]
MVDGEWVDDPNRVKEEFCSHFAMRFQAPVAYQSRLNFRFPYRLNNEQAANLENSITQDEIHNAVWGYGENKSPGPDGFTFEFFRKFWNVIGADVCVAVEWFFDHSSFSKGCNSSFVALILKIQDHKFVNDYHPISLIGSLYKVATKVLANHLSSVIYDLILDVQTAFLPNRQILDGPFIINELLSWCKYKKQQAMVFKVDFAKAYDSIRWDYLDDVLNSFGFGSKWRSWISGSLFSGMASILINGSPTSEFQFHCGLKQGDLLAPYLFILVMESLHLSFSRVVDAGMFRGIRIDSSLMISHLFYADDVVFIGEWSDNNLTHIMRILHCFFLASGLKINLKKSHLLGVGVPHAHIIEAAMALGCSVMRTPFKYLGVVVGGNMSLIKAWDETIGKLKSRLSRWKLNALSIGGRLTLLKSVLGSTPIYTMSLYKVPKSVLNLMESIRRNFFNGIHGAKKRISWVKWSKQSPRYSSNWNSIIREIQTLKSHGVDLFSHCRIRVGNGLRTRFWSDKWVDDTHLRHLFSRVYALEVNKECSVADKLQGSVTTSFRRSARGGIEAHQLAQLQLLIEPTILSNSDDRWVWDLNGDGIFRVKDVRCLLDEFFLPKDITATRWVKTILIKINVFAWKVCIDRLPTRMNLFRRDVQVPSLLCPICNDAPEDTSHLSFNCALAIDVTRLVREVRFSYAWTLLLYGHSTPNDPSADIDKNGGVTPNQYHPQTLGQNKVINRVIKWYLRKVRSDINPKDWSEKASNDAL